MYYPIKLKPVYKDYIWGGRYFEKLNRKLPDGTVAESWELSCHKNGMSVIENGEFAGMTLNDLIKYDSVSVLGRRFPLDCEEIPLLIKLIDANDKLSVQVHCEDNYAAVYEGGLGKNEMWYVIDVKPEAKLVAGLKPGTTKEEFDKAIKENRIEECLQNIDVKPGDVINIPAGLVHSIGAGIVIAEIQQCSDTTYRVFDYNRVDKTGASRPLHIDKALDVIKFDTDSINIKRQGVDIKINENCIKTIFLANSYFACERYNVNGSIVQNSDGSKFCVYICVEGQGNIETQGMTVDFKVAETIFLPAAVSEYKLVGEFKAIKTYVPDFIKDVVEPMRKAGCADKEIYSVLSN